MIPKEQGKIEVLTKACEPGMIRQVGDSKIHSGATKSMKAQGHSGVNIHSFSIVCQCRTKDTEALSKKGSVFLGHGFVNPSSEGPPYKEKETKEELKYAFRAGPGRASFWRKKRKPRVAKQPRAEVQLNTGEI